MQITRYEIRLEKSEKINFDLEHVSSPLKAAEVAKQYLKNRDREHLIIIALDTKLKITGFNLLSIGTEAEANISLKALFKFLILSSATCFIIAHNHPTGDTSPSPEDTQLTLNIKKAADFMSFKLLDHVIIGNENDEIYSFSDNRIIL